MKTSINFKPCKTRISEAHNERKVNLDYVYPERSNRNDSWKLESISDRVKKIRDLYRQSVGQDLQASATPIREAVVVIKQETQIRDLRELARVLEAKFGIQCFQIHIHRDEGHVDETGNFKVNYHAHMVFDWQDKRDQKTTRTVTKKKVKKVVNTSTLGRSIKLGKIQMAEIQTICADVLGMDRGQTNSKAVRLEAKEYKTFAQELEKKKQTLAREVAALEESKKSLRESLLKLTPQIDLLLKLRQLKWAECGPDVGKWLQKHGIQAEIKAGKDGSIWFESKSGQKARLKDLGDTIRDLARERIVAALDAPEALKMRSSSPKQKRPGHRI